MLERLARMADRRAKVVLAITVIFFLAAAWFGGNVADYMGPYGDDDPATESVRAERALEDAGIIAGYRAILDGKSLGLSLMALVHISMDRHTPERFANCEARIALLPEVLECLLITGQEADYQLKVIVRDMDAYQELLLNRITRIEGVTGVHSSFVLRRVIDRTALPV